MRKLSAVLDEVTFLNFPFLWKQILRYRWLMPLFPILFIGCMFMFQKTQFTIYSLNLEAKLASKPGTGVTSGIAQSMMLDGQSAISYEELAALIASYEFQHLIAQEIVASSDFQQMNFTPINASSFRKWKQIFGSCGGSKDCEVDIVTNVINRFYDVKKGQTEGRFTFSVTSLDPMTTQKLARFMIDSITKSRLKATQTVYIQQSQHAEEMIQKSREEMAGHGGVEALGQFKSNEMKMTELKEKITALQNMAGQDLSVLLTMDLKLKESNPTRNLANATSDNRYALNAEKFKNKILKADELRQNIATLSSISPSERSQTDEVILMQLQAELKNLEKELNFSTKNPKQLTDDDNFQSAQLSNKNYLDFESQVLKKKLAKEQIEIKSLSAELEKTIQKNLALESSSSLLRQDMEYIKLLESKLISIKLMIATITPDLLFEKYNTQLDEFNRSSAIKNILFAFLFSFSIYFFTVLFRYFLDDRLYEEHEIKKCFQDLAIIGKTPDFDY
ncbi:MAG: hypothetical protein H7336_17460 [Bacteriovorax sp.]|nr:hypothetical protein [Bacteriovorax sp.]